MQNHIETLISLWRKNGKASPLSKEEIHKLGNALLKLQRGLTGDRNLAGKNYMQDPMFFGAYLLYYWPVSYIQIDKIIQQLDENIFAVKDHFSLLECGSGPAPGTCALLDKIFTENPDAKVDLLLLDSSKNALSTAEKIIRKDYKNVYVKTKVSNLEKDDIPENSAEKKYDFILLSHVLNELWKTEENKIQLRFEYLLKLQQHLSASGLLILNEPAILEASRNLILVRDKLMENGLKLLAPCPESKCTKCPVLETENHTCHGEYFIKGIKILDDLSREAGLNRVSVKMSFFVFENASAIGTPRSVAEGNEGESRKCGKRGHEVETPENSEKILKGKIVSEAMLNKSGRVRFLVCDGERRIPLSAKQNDQAAKKQGFFDLKRYDKIEVENPEIRENGFGMDGASLKILNR